LTEEPFVIEPHDQIAAGGDFGFRSDSSSLVLVALRGDKLHVFDGAEERPTEGAPLKPSKTVETFAKRIAGRCGYLMADGHYREAIAEHLETHGLSYVPAPTTPADTYVRARMLLREGKVRVHGLDFRDRMMQQLREVHGRPTSGGGMSIVHPRWSTGGHGDLAAAFVLALWQLSGDEVPEARPKTGTREWEAEQKRERFERYQAEEQRPHWRRDNEAGAYWRRQ
jgi:hypothetical protein